MKNVFDKATSNEIIERINTLSKESKPAWGKMNVAQMLAHCNVTYEMIYDNTLPKATGLKKMLLKWLVKPIVCNEKPYEKNGRTAPQFIIVDEREFELEKNRLISFITKTQSLGARDFDGKESNSFGKLTSTEWSNMLYKHLNHHLEQFNV